MAIQAKETEKEKIRRKYKPDTISVPTNTRLTLPPFKLLPDQIQYYKDQYAEAGKADEPIPKYEEYIVTSAGYKKDNASLNQDVLMATNVPDWVTQDDLKKIFSPYVEDKSTQVNMNINHREVVDTYPISLIITSTKRSHNRPDRRAYIYFNPEEGNCRLIIFVCRRVRIAKKLPDGRRLVCQLFFNHPKNSLDDQND